MRVAAAIVAGGKASRLGGIAKGLLGADSGLSIVGRLIAELTAAGIAEIVISANDPEPYTIFARPIIADEHREIGPLGGIEAVLQHLAPGCDCVLLLPCDLPNITVQEILELLRVHQTAPDRVVVASTAQGEQPLCAVVPVNVLPAVSAAIASGSYGVGRLWRSLAAVKAPLDDSSRLLNINTPEDLREWRESLGQAGKD
jgi:molybdopterin-guanine dinucleotide biosynthesis protein A